MEVAGENYIVLLRYQIGYILMFIQINKINLTVCKTSRTLKQMHHNFQNRFYSNPFLQINKLFDENYINKPLSSQNDQHRNLPHTDQPVYLKGEDISNNLNQASNINVHKQEVGDLGDLSHFDSPSFKQYTHNKQNTFAISPKNNKSTQNTSCTEQTYESFQSIKLNSNKKLIHLFSFETKEFQNEIEVNAQHQTEMQNCPDKVKLEQLDEWFNERQTTLLKPSSKQRPQKALSQQNKPFDQVVLVQGDCFRHTLDQLAEDPQTAEGVNIYHQSRDCNFTRQTATFRRESFLKQIKHKIINQNKRQRQRPLSQNSQFNLKQFNQNCHAHNKQKQKISQIFQSQQIIQQVFRRVQMQRQRKQLRREDSKKPTQDLIELLKGTIFPWMQKLQLAYKQKLTTITQKIQDVQGLRYQHLQQGQDGKQNIRSIQQSHILINLNQDFTGDSLRVDSCQQARSEDNRNQGIGFVDQEQQISPTFQRTDSEEHINIVQVWRKSKSNIQITDMEIDQLLADENLIVQ